MTESAPPKTKLPPEAFDTPELRRKLAKAILAERHARYPRFWDALEKDAKMFLKVRGEDVDLPSRTTLLREAARLSWETDAFFALALYRARGRLLARGVPILPTVLHKACMALCQLDIGEPVVVEPGVYVPHGQVVIDGNVEIGRGTVLTPWVTIGLTEGDVEGPKIGRWAFIGTGAKVLGDIRVGARAKVGANSVVIRSVPAGATVVGAPGRPVATSDAPNEKMRRAVAEKKRREQERSTESHTEPAPSTSRAAEVDPGEGA